MPLMLRKKEDRLKEQRAWDIILGCPPSLGVPAKPSLDERITKLEESVVEHAKSLNVINIKLNEINLKTDQLRANGGDSMYDQLKRMSGDGYGK